MKVKIAKIKIGSRIRKEIKNIDALAADIKENGLINPITVMAYGGGHRLLAGLRRIRAAEFLGWTEVEATVVTPGDVEAALRLEISENEQREAFTFSEKMALAAILEEIESAKAKERKLAGKKIDVSDLPPKMAEGLKGETREIVASKIGVSKSTYNNMKYLEKNAPPETIDELDDGERTVGSAFREVKVKEKAAKSSEEIYSLKASSENEPARFTEPIMEKTASQSPKTVAHDPAVPLRENTASEKHEKPVPLVAPLDAKPKAQQPKPQLTPQAERKFREEEERLRKVNEWDNMPLKDKVAELEKQLTCERARAATAESELSRLTAFSKNERFHAESKISSLQNQLATAHARIKELEDKYESN